MIKMENKMKDDYIVFKAILLISILLNMVYLFSIDYEDIYIIMLIPNLMLITTIALFYFLCSLMKSSKKLYIIGTFVSGICFAAIVSRLTFIMLYEVGRSNYYIYYLPLVIVGGIIGCISGIININNETKREGIHKLSFSLLIIGGIGHSVFSYIFNVVGSFVGLYIVLGSLNLLAAIILYYIIFWITDRKYETKF